MPRQIQPIAIDDISTFTKNLRNALQQREELPSHTGMLGLVAKAAGYQNYQHLKANAPKGASTTATIDKKLDRAMRTFENGLMVRWPKQTAVQGLCLWVFWAALPARTDLTEQDINTVLKAGHHFGDHALLRRSLIDHRLVTRTNDGAIYRRVERQPPENAQILIAAQRPSNTALRFSRNDTTPS